jgi:hypothetical protein
MQVVEYKKPVKNFKPKTETEELIKKARKEDEKLVKGRFEFTDAQGGFFEFTYRWYPGLIQKFTLVHGETCELPIGLVKHLNNTNHKVHKYMNVEQPENGPLKLPTTYDVVSRVKFIPIEFV